MTKKYVPLCSFSWSKLDNKTSDQILIESTITEWYDAKHRPTSNEEIAYINFIPINNCHLGGSSNITKNGHKKRWNSNLFM